ncbi:MAG: glutamate 5-kinase [Gammaproteobacteria bacterium]
MSGRSHLRGMRRWVVKIGSALLTNDGQGLDQRAIKVWVDQMAALRAAGIEQVLVSSGAIAEGMRRLGWTTRPIRLYQLQAAAAVGQMGLIQVYESCFQRHGMHTAQILLTHEDISDRSRYLNARNTLCALLDLGVIPVVNENDTVSAEEIRLGDNDTLAGLVANLIQADLLLLLTDQGGLYTDDPRRDPEARLISEARAGDPALEPLAGGGGAYGRGGMRTKLQAATLAARSGTTTLIASGRTEQVLSRIAAGEGIGTLLTPGQPPWTARKRWLAGQVRVRGRLLLDPGAARMLSASGKSLLGVGICGVEGHFVRGDIVACMAPDNREIARGLVNYSAEEVRKIMGQPSERIIALLGYMNNPEIIHRDNLVLMPD